MKRRKDKKRAIVGLIRTSADIDALPPALALECASVLTGIVRMLTGREFVVKVDKMHSERDSLRDEHGFDWYL